MPFYTRRQSLIIQSEIISLEFCRNLTSLLCNQSNSRSQTKPQAQKIDSDNVLPGQDYHTSHGMNMMHWWKANSFAK